MAIGPKGWPRGVGALLVVLLIGNSLLVAALNWGRAGEKNVAFREQLSRLRSLSSLGPLDITMHPSFRMATEHRLRAHLIPFERAAKPSCAAPLLFSYPASAQAAACPKGG